MKKQLREQDILQKTIERLKRRQAKLNQEIHLKHNELEDICIHDDCRQEESYLEGGYLHKAEYHTTLICNVCHKIVDKQIKYGGFE